MKTGLLEPSSVIAEPQRIRQHPVLRELVKETRLNPKNFILPLFIKGEKGEKVSIPTLPGHYQIPLSRLKQEIKEICSLGIGSVLLFGIPPVKDCYGSSSYHSDGIIQKSIAEIREVTHDLLIICDVCFCNYTDHGHCGVLKETRRGYQLDKEKTLELLARQAVSYAEAGADVVAPSGMIDNMVRSIRQGLDQEGFSDTTILSYTAKYQSSFYGPFRMAAEGAPTFGDRSGHQMDPANGNEVLKEALLDIQEGADIFMIKPAHAYLDIIYRFKEHFPYLPLAAYHTSGEYAMLKAASEKGWVDEKKGVLEVLTAIKRAGADMIISYYTKELIEKSWI